MDTCHKSVNGWAQDWYYDLRRRAQASASLSVFDANQYKSTCLIRLTGIYGLYGYGK
jgi:hypothetical protein